MKVLATARAVARSYGARGLVLRAVHEARKRARAFRRDPRANAARAGGPPAGWPFVAFPGGAPLERATRERALLRAERVRDGAHDAYRDRWTELPPTADAWRTNAETGTEYARDVPWFEVAHRDARRGDIKDVWEPARFGWAYDLARGRALTGDASFAEAFWRHFEAFRQAAPPFRGVHWSCGQESAIRGFALLWAEGAFAAGASPARLAALRATLVHTAERVADAIGYAESQRNNHGLSEAAFLCAAGARFDGQLPEARGWLRRGRHVLARLVRDQFAPDGWYVQHSFTYLRVALDQCTLAERALASRGEGLGEGVRARVAAAVTLLAHVCDERTGDVPNHGANDGAYVFPVSSAPFRDFRPALTAAAATFRVPLAADVPPDAETLAWLGAAPPSAGPRRPPLLTGASGWASARVGDAALFARAGRYASRPAHIDAAHVDVRFGGEWRAIDAGSYRYTAPAPWNDALGGPELHNTLSVPGAVAAERGPGFLWIGAPEADVVRAVVHDDGAVEIELANETWARTGVHHRRRCLVAAREVTVTDAVTVDDGERTVAVHWLCPLHVAPPLVTGAPAPSCAATVGGADASVLGWVSTHYARRDPALSLTCRTTTQHGHATITSVFRAAPSDSLPSRRP